MHVINVMTIVLDNDIGVEAVIDVMAMVMEVIDILIRSELYCTR